MVRGWHRLACAGGLLLALGLQASAEDWPRFRGAHGDGIARETGLLKSFPATGLKVLWQRDLTGGWSAPSIAGGRLYTMTEDAKEEIVLCLDAATGKPIWEHRYAADYDKHPTLDARFKSGPRATPTVDGDHVYTIGTTGEVHCLDAKTGKPVWRRNLLEIAKIDCPMPGYCSSPAIVGDALYVQPGGKGTSVMALKKRDGSILWQSQDDPVGFGTPIQIENNGVPQVLYFTGAALVSVAPKDGKLLWRQEWKTAFDLNVATPIYHNGQVFISSNYGRGCALLTLKGEAAPEEVYRSANMQNHFSTSVLHQGHLYGLSNDRLRCVDWATGETKWDQRGTGRGNVLLADGQLIVLTEKGDLLLADASPAAFTEKSRWKALEGTCWTAPVLANGILYLRNESKLMALDFRASGAATQ